LSKTDGAERLKPTSRHRQKETFEVRRQPDGERGQGKEKPHSQKRVDMFNLSE
jgi:hypothetical protein